MLQALSNFKTNLAHSKVDNCEMACWLNWKWDELSSNMLKE